ncbi:MAG TPA: DNA (cytosine-5-)-methyltransferase, partial [Pyrinomonadaceae bacterium]
KKEGIRDSRGTLFQTIATILARHQPTYFVLENVKRLLLMEQGSHFATILSVLADLDYWIEWRLLNAMHFGLPQNRQRVFLIGVHRNKYPSHGSPPIRLATKEDLSELSGNRLDELLHPADWKGIAEHGQRIPAWGIASQGRFFAATLSTFSERSPLTPLRSVLETEVSSDFDFTESTLERLKGSKPVMRYIDGVEILSNQSGGARMGYTVFGIDGVAPTLTATTSRHYERYKVGERYRRLTNTEYARIQGFPDDHCKAVSVHDQYGLIGNAVPPRMADWVLKKLLGDGSYATAPSRPRPGAERCGVVKTAQCSPVSR